MYSLHEPQLELADFCLVALHILNYLGVALVVEVDEIGEVVADVVPVHVETETDLGVGSQISNQFASLHERQFVAATGLGRALVHDALNASKRAGRVLVPSHHGLRARFSGGGKRGSVMPVSLPLSPRSHLPLYIL